MTSEQTERLTALRQQFRTMPYGSELTPEEKTEMSSLCRLEKAEDRERFGESYPWMVDLLYRHDPIRLATAGVPPDEYENEARMVLHEIHGMGERPKLGQVLQIVHGIFRHQFGEEYVGIAEVPYLLISREICNSFDSKLAV